MNATSFDIIVIGSGVAGLSVAMEFARRGKRALVIERGPLASGATSRAAGLIGQMRSTPDGIRLLMDSIRIIREVEAQTGMRVLEQTGSVRVAQTHDRVVELQRDMDIARGAGLHVERVTASELEKLIPCMRADDVLDACFCPSDCYLEAPALALAYIAAGRQLDVTYIEHTRVESLRTSNGNAIGVRAADVDYDAPIVINAAGPWAHLVADYAQQFLPTAGIAHYYFTTKPEANIAINAASPSFRDRENRIYGRPCNGGIRVGIYEALPEHVDMAALSPNFQMSTVSADASKSVIRSLLDAASLRFPSITASTPMEIRGGIMAFSPDGGPLLGELEGVSGFYHCAGFCGHGVSQSAAIGPVVADLIMNGTCEYDLGQLRADRFSDWPSLHNRDAVVRSCLDVYANYYGKPII
ncbi:MAG: FAD-binding oxidoreductase [Candidatus Hydrogenedentes bacterium]|nr:FAD-binding oxidoreductase [Candidatus Hydrogenedentota bacterium]